MHSLSYIFFGTSRFSVLVLEELKKAGFLPTLIVTVPDKPKGRKLVMTPPETKVWAIEHGVSCIQLESLKGEGVENQIRSYGDFEVGIVASYGLIIPNNILKIPRRETLNVHPSLLPKLRGASPIVSSILALNETGVTIIHLDSLMDHGKVIAQEKTHEWPDFLQDNSLPYAETLETELGVRGGELLARILPQWLLGTVVEKEQDHDRAIFCKKIEKVDGQIGLDDLPEINIRKIRAYHSWPHAFFWFEHGNAKIRVIVKQARIEGGLLVIERVVPEGRKEMSYTDFLNGFSHSPS